MNYWIAVSAALAMLSPRLPAQDLDWPQFRGPRGDGSTLSSGLPLRWDEQRNVKWKTPIPGRAWSSPVIRENQIWLTTATEDGRVLSAVCVDRDSGRVLRDLRLFDVERPQYCHPFNTYASPTPVIAGERLYLTFGAAATACLDTRTGEIIWARRDFECNHFRGPGSSPILHGSRLFLNFDGSDHQFVVALDAATGRTLWRRERSIDFKDLGLDGKPQMDGDYRKAFATCHILEAPAGPILLSQGSKALYAYEPETGAELWRLEERTSYSGSTRPVIGHGLIFLPSGFSSGQLLALRPGKRDDILDARTNSLPGVQLEVVWRARRNVPKKPSLLLVDKLLFGVDDNGTATCWEALTGGVVWSQSIGGHYSASPLAAPGRLYFFSEEGKTTILAPDRQFRKLAENQLGDGFMASPAVSGNALFLRSRTHLYRIEAE
jgi:outer membrane protein assembly factor BamB